MIKRNILLITALLFMSQINFAQDHSTFEEINIMWSKFTEAFESLDAELFAEIHSKDLIRIPGGRSIMDFDTYINNYKNTFEKSIASKTTRSISFRFFERVNTDSIASERGYYKTVRNINQPDEKIFYGEFHVLLKKEGGTWKIFMDYDSNEDNIVDEKVFNGAKKMNEFDNISDQ